MTESRTLGPISIKVPPEPSLSRVLRLAASGVASLANFSIDEIDDIKIAVSEVLIALIEHGSGNVVEIEMTVDEESFRISGCTVTDEFDVDNPDLVLCRRVLEGVGAEHGVDVAGGAARIWAHVRHISTG